MASGDARCPMARGAAHLPSLARSRKKVALVVLSAALKTSPHKPNRNQFLAVRGACEACAGEQRCVFIALRSPT
jgi:hypothetical protein